MCVRGRFRTLREEEKMRLSGEGDRRSLWKKSTDLKPAASRDKRKPWRCPVGDGLCHWRRSVGEGCRSLLLGPAQGSKRRQSQNEGGCKLYWGGFNTLALRFRPGVNRSRVQRGREGKGVSRTGPKWEERLQRSLDGGGFRI
jgi:hypothetical protein